MKRSIFGQLLLVVTLLLLCQSSFAQEQKYVTEQFFVPKSQCVIHAYDLEDFLKSKGLYGGQKTNYLGVGKLNWMKKKVQIGDVDFTKDCTFILELMGETLPKDDDSYEFLRKFWNNRNWF